MSGCNLFHRVPRNVVTNFRPPEGLRGTKVLKRSRNLVFNWDRGQNSVGSNKGRYRLLGSWITTGGPTRNNYTLETLYDLYTDMHSKLTLKTR